MGLGQRAWFMLQNAPAGYIAGRGSVYSAEAAPLPVLFFWGGGRSCPRQSGRALHRLQGHGAPVEDLLIAKLEEEKVRVNNMIRARQVRVIDEEGNQLGIMSPYDAIREAEERGLDLVEVAAKAVPPVCRIMDYGKYRYQQSKRAKESKKHQHTITVKEIKYRPKIDEHDFQFKTNHVREFLQEGDKVKITIMFRGREMAHPEFGREILQKVVESTKDLVTEPVDVAGTRLEGRNMSMVLTPTPKQA
jgi:translation initiation factor IF-3